MLKQFSIFIALLAALMAGAYQLRIQLITGVVNSALRNSDLELLQLEQLAIGLDGLDIGRLVVATGPDRTPQHLRDLHLSYTLLQAKPEQLEIAHAALQLPGGQDDSVPLAITDLLAQLLRVPLESVSIAAVELRDWSHPLLQWPVAVKAQWQNEQLDLLLLNNSVELDLGLNDRRAEGVQLRLNLAAHGRAVSELELTLLGTGNAIRLEGRGELDLESLVVFLAPLSPMPEAVSSIGGRIPFDLTALLADQLSQPGPLQGSIRLHPNTRLTLTTRNAGEPHWDADIGVDLPQEMLLEMSANDVGDPLFTLAAGEVSLALTENSRSLQGRALLKDVQCYYPTPLCQATLGTQLEAPALILEGTPATQLQNVAMSLSASASLDGEQLTLEFSPGELLRAELLQRGDFLMRETALANIGPARLEYRLAAPGISVAADRLQLLLPRLKLPELNIATVATVSNLRLSRGSGNQLSGSAHMVAEGINLQRPGGWLPALAVSSDIDIGDQQMTVNASLGSGLSRELFTLSANYDLDEAKLKGQLLTNDIDFNAEQQRLSGHFASWPYDWDIVRGQLTLRADFNWPGTGEAPALSAKINSSWEDMAGAYGEIGFIGLGGKAAANFSAPDELVMSRDGSVSLERLDIGVPIEAIEARFRVDSRRQQIRVPAFEARLFGGRIWTDNVNYRASRSSNRIDIGVDGLQLDQLLAMTGYDAVEGTGSISGLLPLNVNAAGITMERGMLAARDPGGIFRYKADLGTDDNAAMAQVSEALSNYHYSIFQTEADYLENGDLELAMQLRGRNPDMAQSRPIHLNLNVTDNIPMLLKSLQSGRTIADLVSKKMGSPDQ